MSSSLGSSTICPATEVRFPDLPGAIPFVSCSLSVWTIFNGNDKFIRLILSGLEEVVRQ
jgi:hypothetical protein